MRYWIIFLTCIITSAGAQELPEKFSATFPSTKAAYLSLNSQYGDVGCFVEYRNSGGEDYVDLMFLGESGFTGGFLAPSSIRENVSFNVTGVCPDKNVADAMYVCGWQKRTGKVVVERWTLQGLAVGATVSPQNPATTIYSLTTPTVRRVSISDFVSTEACRAIAHIGATDNLYLLVKNGYDVIYELDMSGSLTEKYNSGPSSASPVIAALDSLNYMRSAQHTSLGHVVYLDPMAFWDTNPMYANHPADAKAVFLVDSDSNGTVDQVIVEDYYTEASVGDGGSWQ